MIFIFIFINKEFAVKISYQAKPLKYFRNLPLVEISGKLCFLPSSFSYDKNVTLHRQKTARDRRKNLSLTAKKKRLRALTI